MAEANRDDFSAKTKRDLAQRAGYVCSRLECSAHTVGPSDESIDAVSNVGVAAHIAAAASGPGARRYDPGMTEEQRSSIENGIWLCQTCSKLIDTDEQTYTVEVLRRMKADAVARAKQRLGQALEVPLASGLTVEAANCVYIKSHRAAYVSISLVNARPEPMTVKAIRLKLGDRTYVPNKPRENLKLDGLDWLQPGPLRLEGNDAVAGAWFFGWSFAGGGSHVEASPDDKAELYLCPVIGPEIRGEIVFSHPDCADEQGGRAVVHAGPGSQAEHREHDRALFRKFDEVIPETALIRLADRLQTDDQYSDSEVEPVGAFLDLAKLEGNRFSDEGLGAASQRLVDALKKLVAFFGGNFFLYPNRQPPGGDTEYALHPDWNVDRGRSFDPDNDKKYFELQHELDELVKEVREAYRAYRSAIRAVLAE